MLRDYSNYIKNGDISATNFTGSLYQLKLALAKTPTIGNDTSVQALAGTGIHSLAEDYYSKMPNKIVENRATRELNGLSISGTADLIEYNYTTSTWTISDHKTKGAYSALKFLRGDTEAETIQLSINRWIRQHWFINTENIGTIYLYIIGDIPHQNRKEIPDRRIEASIPLYTYEETQKYMESKIEEAMAMQEPQCEKWRCEYCDYECSFRK